MKWLLAIGLIWFAWHYLRPDLRPARRMIAPSAEQRARTLLGVARDADEGDIRAAHRRLLADIHPDRGGSAAAATEINAARDLLLDSLRRG